MTGEHQEQDEVNGPPQEAVSFTSDRMTFARPRRFELEPILSPYLRVFSNGFRIKTPYSRTVDVSFGRYHSREQ